MRNVPKLRYVVDEQEEHADHINRLIDTLDTGGD